MSVIIDGLDNVIIKVRINEQNLKFTIPYNTSVSELKKQVKNNLKQI